MESWLPIGFPLPGGYTAHRAVSNGQDWQICDSVNGERLLIVKEQLANRWIASGLLGDGAFARFSFGTDALFLLDGGCGRTLEPLQTAPSPSGRQQALARAHAFRETREIDAKSPLHDALYVERFAKLLPTGSLSAPIEDGIVFGAWLTGGVPVSVDSIKRLRSLTAWISPADLDEVLRTAGFDTRAEPGVGTDGSHLPPRRFALTGRPNLEQFLIDHVVDIVENQARYKALGIVFPSAIILHGPPGCGKTFAIEQLVEHLGWPSFSIEASTVASPYIHETSRKVATVFEEAVRNAPSIVIIDEMEAFLAERQHASAGQHHVEEVAEFLRRIPEAVGNRVLVVAMTNRIDMIDPAILRRGRFDHVIKVEMASESEVAALLQALLSQLPQDGPIGIGGLAARLAGRPMSDVSYVVREGARIAAKQGKHRIDQASLLAAVATIDARAADQNGPRRVGFI